MRTRTRLTMLFLLMTLCSCAGAALSDAPARNNPYQTELPAKPDEAAPACVAPAPAEPPVQDKPAPPITPSPPEKVEKQCPTMEVVLSEFPEPSLKGWYCTMLQETVKPYMKRSFCDRTRETCEERRLTMSSGAMSQVSAGPCKFLAKAFCIRVNNYPHESVFNWCADTLARCQIHIKVVKNNPVELKVLKDCTLRE